MQIDAPGFNLGSGSAVQAGRAAMGSREGEGANAGRRVEATKETDPADHTDPSTPAYREVQELKARDREVRQHEQAHVAAGGQYVSGGPTFSYQNGPDGRRYAVGGEVQIDTSAVKGDPEATIRKMEVVQRAAMAPAEPSAQDRSVAAQAAQTAAQARADLQQQRMSGEGEDLPQARAVERAYGAQNTADLQPLIDLMA